MTGLVFSRYQNSGGEFVLALALADHAWDDGTHIWPSVKTLAEKTRQSRRAVQYQLRSMLDSGWLQLVKKSSGRPGFCNEYRINPDWITGAEIAPVERQSQKCSTENTETLVEEMPPDGDGSYPQTGANTTPLTGASFAPFDVETGANGDETGAIALHPNHHINHHKKIVVVDDNARASSGESYPQDEVFGMFIGWQITKNYLTQILGQIVSHEMLTAERLAEFVSYWCARPDVALTQAQWEHKLLQRLHLIQTRQDLQHGKDDVFADMSPRVAATAFDILRGGV